MSPVDVEQILADFRSWLEQGPPPPVPAPEKTVDLATLVGQFTALRHEVNLQTRAARNLQEQIVQALEKLNQEHVDSGEAGEETLRPLLKGLIETHDALYLARREVERGRQNLLRLRAPQDARVELLPPPTLHLELPWWARLLGVSRHARLDARSWERYCEEHWSASRQSQNSSALEPCLRVVEAIATGYGMSLERLERLLEQFGLQAIDPAGESFDPEHMEAIDVLNDPEQPSGLVIDVLRRGYAWNGRPFRTAQVRVNRAV